MSFILYPKKVVHNSDEEDLKDESKSFTPKSMIDILFDYKDFLTKADNHGSIASINPKKKKQENQSIFALYF